MSNFLMKSPSPASSIRMVLYLAVGYTNYVYGTI